MNTSTIYPAGYIANLFILGATLEPRPLSSVQEEEVKAQRKILWHAQQDSNLWPTA